MNRAEFNNIIEKINKIWLDKYISTDGHNMTQDVYNLAKDINSLPEVTNVDLGNCIQVNYYDIDNDKTYLNEYPLLIEINNIKINAKIRLIPTRKYGYNVVLEMKNDFIFESYEDEYSKFSIHSFIKELRKCKSFEDIKRAFKKYAVEATTIGTLLTIVLSSFALTDSQVRELGYINDSNIVQAEHFYIYDEDEEDKMEPQWKLLCNDTEVTVYHAKKSQCNSDVQNTASMFKLNLEDPESHRIIAMERTMMKQYNLSYGDLVKIEGTGDRDGVYQIQDTMNKRFKGKHKIDILINNDSEIGKWNNVKVYKLSNPEYCYDIFKEYMSDALNQDSVNRRQRTDF